MRGRFSKGFTKWKSRDVMQFVQMCYRDEMFIERRHRHAREYAMYRCEPTVGGVDVTAVWSRPYGWGVWLVDKNAQ